MSTAKQRYIKACEEQDTEWLMRVITPPSHYLTRTHVVLILLVLRRRGVDVEKLGAYHV